jgi:hypothetical protein
MENSNNNQQLNAPMVSYDYADHDSGIVTVSVRVTHQSEVEALKVIRDAVNDELIQQYVHYKTERVLALVEEIKRELGYNFSAVADDEDTEDKPAV